MEARFVDVSMSEIDQFKENVVPQKTKDATKFGVKLFQGRLIKFSFANNTIAETSYVCLHFFASKCRQLFVTIAKYFVLQNGFKRSKSSQMNRKNGSR